MRKILMIVAMLAASAGVGALTGATPASAADYGCGAGEVCLFSDASYETTGCKSDWVGNNNDYRAWGYEYTSSACYYKALNNSVSSIKNRGNSYSTRHYKDAFWAGDYRTLARGASWSTLVTGLKDALSSHQWIA